MSNMANDDIKVAFDNGGGAVLVSHTYAHSYDDGKQLAADVRNLLDGGDTDQWDGNDDELRESLTLKELSRYEIVYRVSEIDKLLNSEDENVCVGVSEDSSSVEIFWGGGGRPQVRNGHTEHEFWSTLVGGAA